MVFNNSFSAVKSFLQSGLPYSEQGGIVKCEMLILPHNKKQPISLTINFNGILCYYIENDFILKGFGFHDLSTDNNVFTWEESSNSLSVENDRIKLKFKRNFV